MWLVTAAVVSVLVFAGTSTARASGALLSVEAVANPVSTGTTYLNPDWTFSSSDLSYQMSTGSNTSTVPCFAIHTDLGTFGDFSAGGSGSDTTTAPQGAPDTGGAWRTWCYNGLPTHVQGESQASLQISSTQSGTAEITAYLLRYGQLSEGFAKSVIVQTSLRLVFGASPAPPPKQTGETSYQWSVKSTHGQASVDEVGKWYVYLASLQGSGKVVTSASGSVADASGAGRFFFLVSESIHGPGQSRTFGFTVLPTGARLLKASVGVDLILNITVSPTRLQDADLACLAHPDGTLELLDGRGATGDRLAIRDICGTRFSDVSDNHLLVTIREQ